MTHIITIETHNDSDFAQIKGFAQRLGLNFKESHSEGNDLEAQQEAAFKKFVGSWQGEETAEELEKMIYSARNDQPRDIEL
ncbi:hypothetical protein P1X15_31925 [Runella sp. MFBS21]|uniref:hypothetical protein n=1 Tax=Runella sp. MFBS21 TaxID=3034018 RepID=UPI0023F78991|nr:hypothetical protein [Runella sp. MFBS21]MDF7822266.1 hypothetical protein [Runella sp. MFBS21]